MLDGDTGETHRAQSDVWAKHWVQIQRLSKASVKWKGFQHFLTSGPPGYAFSPPHIATFMGEMPAWGAHNLHDIMGTPCALHWHCHQPGHCLECQYGPVLRANRSACFAAQTVSLNCPATYNTYIEHTKTLGSVECLTTHPPTEKWGVCPLCGQTSFRKHWRLHSIWEVLRCLFFHFEVTSKEIMGISPPMRRSFQSTNTFNTFACLDQLCGGCVYWTSDIRYQKRGDL